jgi:hypothetical protein
MFTHFKNDSIRKLVVAFGSLFSNVQLEQTDENNNERIFTVPITYGPKEKFVKRLTEPSSISDKTRIEISLPRMSFEFSQFVYDPTRKFNKTNKITSTSDQYGNISSAYAEVPYNFVINFSIYTRNLEENFQIMEQILPYFSPEFVVSLKMNSLNESVDVPISIINTTLTQEYEGDFSTRRFIVSSYQFVAKSYIYGKISTNQTVIQNFNFGLYDMDGITLISEIGITG